MTRAAHSLLGWLAALLLGAVALMGLGLSGVFLLVSTDTGRSFLVPRLVRVADDALAGRIELDSFHLESQGGIGLEGLRVFDPDGDLVLSVQRALVTVDLVRPRSRTFVLRVDLDRPAVLLKQEEDGSLSLARAFAPTHPSNRPSGTPTGEWAWTVRIGHLAVSDGSVRYTTAAGATAIDAKSISLEGRGEHGRNGSQVELKLRGELVAPAAQPAALDLEASLRGGTLRVSVLRASLGDSAVDVVAEGDLPRRSGRIAVLGMRLSGAEARALAPREPFAGEISGVAYGESNGREATAAVELEAGAARAGGTARAAAAMRLAPGTPAAGFDVALDGLDPSRVLSAFPPGSITLTARGRAAGKSLEDVRGALDLSLAPSRLRGGRIGPGEIKASAAGGHFEVTRLALSSPGGALEGAGRYRWGGAAEGRLSADANDLGALGRNLEALLGTKLPPMAGSAHLSAEAGGTAAAPTARIALSAPLLSVGDAAVRDLSISGELQGPRQALQGRLEASAAALALGRLQARSAGLRASVQGRSADLAFTGLVPAWGNEPVALRGAGELTADRARLQVSKLDLSYPGTRFTLSGPAEVVLEGPSVDRLELASGEQRVAISGGIRGRSLDVTAVVDALALGRLPKLLPPDLELDGRLSARAHASGRVVPGATGRRLRALVAEAHAELANGAVRGVTGLSAGAELGYEQEPDRLSLRLDVRRARGGELSAQAELPADLARAAPARALSAQVALRSFPVAELGRFAVPEAPEEFEGEADAEATLAGTVGAPTLSATIGLAGAVYGEWGPGAVHATVEGEASETRLAANVDLRGGRLLAVDARASLDLSELLREPARAARGLDRIPVAATVTAPGFDLSRVAGMGGIPERISGSIAGQAVVHGTWRAPRIEAALALSEGAYRAYTGLGLHAEAKAGEGSVELTARGGLRASEVLRLSARVGLPLERLTVRPALDQAPFSLEAVILETALDRVQPGFPVSGSVAGSLKARGTLASPRIDLDLRARHLSVQGGPLGDVDGSAQYAGSDGRASLELRAAKGGTLRGELRVAASLGLAALRRGGLGASPAEARLLAKGLDLAFLSALAPGAVRSSQGTLDADVRAQGPLSDLRPLGTMKLAARRLAVWELGEWTDVALDASVDRDLLRIAKLEAHRGGGWVTAQAEARGLAGRGPAELTGKLESHDLTIARAGQDLATLSLDMSLGGRLDRRDVRAEVTIPSATVRLPRQSPRPLQSLEARSDIAIGPSKRKAAAVAPPGAEAPLHALIHVLVPNGFWVKGESPRADVELKADVTLEIEKGELLATGSIDTLHGVVEPMRGRLFAIDKGRVQFLGGPPKAAVLDVTATYDNPAAKVKVVVNGPVADPQIHMSSQPPLDESQIALLIATGRSEFKANSGGVGTLGTEERGQALASVASQLFKDMVAEKLPIDTVAVEPGQLRAGTYVTDKIYVGYTRRFESQSQQNVNQNELRFEYQITPRWNFELRYGDAGTGGASIIWSRDY